MSLVHVRIVTSDRTIHHFDSLEAADGLVVISGQIARGRRLYRITPAGRQALAEITTNQE